MRAAAAATVAHPAATARRPAAGTGGHRQARPVRAVGGGGGGSSVAARAARMLPGRLCLVPLLLALGVGSGGGSGDGGDSRRRRLLAAKGGCWGSFFLSRREAGRAGSRVQTADFRGHHRPFLVAASASARTVPEVSALSWGPKRFSGPISGRGPGAKEKARSTECRELWGLCLLGWDHRGLGSGMLGAGPGMGALRGRGVGEAGVCLLLFSGQEPEASSEERAKLDSSLGMAWELVGF